MDSGSKPGSALELFHLHLGPCSQPADFFPHSSSLVSGLNTENGDRAKAYLMPLSQRCLPEILILTWALRYSRLLSAWHPPKKYTRHMACLASSLTWHLHSSTLPIEHHPSCRPLPEVLELSTTPTYPECVIGEGHFLELGVPTYHQASAMDFEILSIREVLAD